jgi:hypothetical protein
MSDQGQQCPEEALVQCNKCKGKGAISVGEHPYDIKVMCPRCLGKGKTDWVSNITGSNDYRPMSGGINGMSGYAGVSGYAGHSGYTGVSGVQGISGFSFYGVQSGYNFQSGPSPPAPIQQGVPIIHPPSISIPQYSPSVVNVPISEPKPTKRSRLLQKIRDNTIQKLNELL